MAAELIVRGKSKRDIDVDVDAILAVEGSVGDNLIKEAHRLGINVQEIPVGIYRM